MVAVGSLNVDDVVGRWRSRWACRPAGTRHPSGDKPAEGGGGLVALRARETRQATNVPTGGGGRGPGCQLGAKTRTVPSATGTNSPPSATSTGPTVDPRFFSHSAEQTRVVAEHDASPAASKASTQPSDALV